MEFNLKYVNVVTKLLIYVILFIPDEGYLQCNNIIATVPQVTGN